MELGIPRSITGTTPRDLRILQHFNPHTEIHLHRANSITKNDYREMRNLFRPILYLMAMLGLFHPSKLACSEGTAKSFRYSNPWRYFTMALSLCNIAYMCANLIVLVVARPTIDIYSFTSTVYIIVMVWLGTAVVLAVLQFIICESPNRFDRMWDKWAMWARHPRTHRRDWARMRMKRNFYVGISVLVVAVPTIIVPVVLNYNVPGSGIEEFLELVKREHTATDHIWWTVNFTILTFCIFGTVCFTSVFFVMHCMVLADELRSLFHMISEPLNRGTLWNVVKEGDEHISVLEQLRRRRLECRDLVDAADRTFEEMAFFSLFANVPLIVFVAYGLVSYSEQTEFKLAMGVIALLGSMIQVLFITIAAAWIHEYAASPKKKIHTLKVQNNLEITRANMMTLTLLLDELSSESIGITAWRFATITKEFIITVVGLALTYIIILMEFRHIGDVLKLTEQISEHIHAGAFTPNMVDTGMSHA